MTQLSIAPQGFWLKTHFYREGDHLNVVAYSCIAGSPEVFRFSVDIRPIVAAVVKYHNRLHEEKISGEELDYHVSGLLDDFAKGVSNVAKGAARAVSSPGRALKSAASLAVSPAMAMNRAFELVPGVSAARSAVMNKMHPQMNAAYGGMMGASSLKALSAKSVVKAGKSALISQVSGAVKGAVGGALQRAVSSSVSFPKVGMPAIGAFASANSALNAIKQANGAMAAVRKVASGATSSRQKNLMRGALNKWAGATIKSAVAQKVPLPGGMGPVAQALKLVKGQADNARRSLSTIATASRAGSVQAKQAARIVALAKANQDRLSAIKRASVKNLPRTRGRAPVSSNLNGFPALLVSSTGQIVPGRYVEKASAPSQLVLRGGKVMRGRFAAVSGDLDNLIGASHYGGDDIGSVGCANPFTRPAHLR